MKLLLATPCFGGQLTADFVGSMLLSMNYCGEQKHSVEVFFTKNESCIARARNTCAGKFLRGDYDKLLFIDADQTWRPEDLAALLTSDKTLIGGTYAKKTLPWDLNFVPLPADRESHFPGEAVTPSALLAFAEERGPEAEVTALPTGFLLISREVFLALQEGCPSYLMKENQHAEEHRYWDFFPAGVLGGTYLTEDHYFCAQAKAAGHPPFLATNVIVGHIGPFNYMPQREVR